MQLLKSLTGRILIESHRGAEKLAPENSWRGLQIAHQLGADLIEVDVQSSADGVAFLRHHYTLPDGRACREVAWRELAELRIGAEPLPRLDDVLVWARDVNACLSLDLKSAFIPQTTLTTEVVRVIEKTQTQDRVLLIAWDHAEIAHAKKLCPALKTRALIRCRLLDLPRVIHDARADCVSLSYDLIRPGDVAQMHALGVAIALAEMWQPDFEFARASGVDIVSWGDPGEAQRGLGNAQ
ncbi:MAG: glycerophosphodiester phosphodiesterase [Chloroflexi bacterium]|nr:glycerophosphodiester phosphodiesterase [Chloroflexota bacterium]